MVSHFDTLLILFFFLFAGLCLNSSTFLNLMIIAEMLWIIIFIIFLVSGQFYDSLILLSVTFFLLVLAACEMSQGLLLLNFKYSTERSIMFLITERSNSKFKTTRHGFFTKK